MLSWLLSCATSAKLHSYDTEFWKPLPNLYDLRFPFQKKKSFSENICQLPSLIYMPSLQTVTEGRMSDSCLFIPSMQQKCSQGLGRERPPQTSWNADPLLVVFSLGWVKSHESIIIWGWIEKQRVGLIEISWLSLNTLECRSEKKQLFLVIKFASHLGDSFLFPSSGLNSPHCKEIPSQIWPGVAYISAWGWVP